MAAWAVAGREPTAQRLTAIKNQLRAEHTATWGDILIPDGLVPPVTEQNRSITIPFNESAVAEADAIAWQWGFWPFTRIETLAS
jgi:hypothetical protein